METIDIENLEIQDGAVPSINKSAKIERKFMFSESELRERLSKTEFEVTQEVQWEDRNKGLGFHESLGESSVRSGLRFQICIGSGLVLLQFQNFLVLVRIASKFSPWIPAKDDI